MRMRVSRYVLLAGMLLLVFSQAPSAQATLTGYRAGFPKDLPGGRVSWSPVMLADLDGNAKPEIIVGSEDGFVSALRADGTIIWSHNVADDINARAAVTPGLSAPVKRSPIRGAPAVGDLDGDGVPEIIVPVGDAVAQVHGGLVALNSQGQLLWAKVNRDLIGSGYLNGSPDGFADGTVSSPAIGDITGDGVPDIVHGSFEQYLYARNSAGNVLPGWPVNALDTVWSSPALADLDGDGVLEMIIGVDAHTYNGPPRPSQDGGELYAFKGDGSILWRSPQDEIMQSSPAVGDLDGDGQLEIAAGTGTFYSDPPFSRAVGRYFSVWNHDGSLRWRTPLPERVFGSPALGDLNGDGMLDVTVGVLDGKVYAFNGANGAILWAAPVKDIFDNYYTQPAGSPPPQLNASLVLGDFDGDGLDDIFIPIGWDVAVLKGNTGAQLTGAVRPNPPRAANLSSDPRPMFHTDYSMLSTPALGDLDGDGKLELVAASGKTDVAAGRVYVWNLPNSTAKSSWPMFRHEASHNARIVEAKLQPEVSSLSVMLTPNQTRSFAIAIKANDGRAITWTLKQENDPSNIVHVANNSGSANDAIQLVFSPDTALAGLAAGSYEATLTIGATGLPDATVQVRMILVENVNQLFLPLLRR